jgi:hypothetical protein
MFSDMNVMLIDALVRERQAHLMEKARIDRLLERPQAGRPKAISRWLPNIAQLLAGLKLG